MEETIRLIEYSAEVVKPNKVYLIRAQGGRSYMFKKVSIKAKEHICHTCALSKPPLSAGNVACPRFKNNHRVCGYGSHTHLQLIDPLYQDLLHVKELSDEETNTTNT